MFKFIIHYNDTIIPAIVLIIFLLVRPRLSGPYLYLFIYLCLVVPILGYSNILADQDKHNLHLYHILTILESFLILNIINQSSLKPYRFMPLVIGIFVFFAVINAIFLEPLFTSFNVKASSILNLIVSIFCFRFFFQIANDEEVLYFQKNPEFWILSGFLFYSITSSLILANYALLEMSSKFSIIIWHIQEVSNIVRFALISAGLICYYKRASPSGFTS